MKYSASTLHIVLSVAGVGLAGCALATPRAVAQSGASGQRSVVATVEQSGAAAVRPVVRAVKKSETTVVRPVIVAVEQANMAVQQEGAALARPVIAAVEQTGAAALRPVRKVVDQTNTVVVQPIMEDPPTLDAAASFTTVRANAEPGACGCFYMYGGSGQVVANDPSGLSFVFDFGQTRTSNINGGGHDLSLTTYLAGLRYHHGSVRKFTPYGQVLVGAGHSATNFDIDRSTSTIAFAPGGGIDYEMSPRFAIRLVQAEYLLTHVPNGVNNRQNQLRLTAGVVFHITKPRAKVKTGAQ